MSSSRARTATLFPRAGAQTLVDLAALCLSFVAAFFLRFDGAPAWPMVKRALLMAPYVALLEYAVLALFGVPQFAWRYIGLREALRIAQAVVVSSLVLVGFRLCAPLLIDVHTAFRWTLIPLGVIAGNLMFAVGSLVGLRTLRRWLVERRDREHRLVSSEPPLRTLVVGAGDATVALLRLVGQHPELGIDPVGIVDDDATTHGTRIQGVRVLGATKDIAELCGRHDIEQAILSLGDQPRESIRTILGAFDGARVPVKVLPSVESLVGAARAPSLRPIDITDLLRRSAVTLESDDVDDFLRGRVVLVTGAGGSIGSELCRQILAHGPRRLLMVERSEHALYEIHRELSAVTEALVPLLVDVTDEDVVRDLFARERPSVVFHAAAHKHVPLLETNIREAIRNNVEGTRVVADAALEHGAESFVLISTDKAVNPSSVMGTTKRIAELYVQSLARDASTRFSAVRFGNVLGSSGSVVPLFRRQIAEGGPVTVTHPDVRRYFMTIPEATSLVLSAGALGTGGEIFILDMGAPVRIVDLAEDMIRLSGLVPHRDIRIEFTGLRPGEKLFEELSVDEEAARPTRHPMIHVARTREFSSDEVRARVAELLRCAAAQGTSAELAPRLGALVPEARLEVA